MIQISIIKISEYGPWTLTLGSDREHRLQMLQARLYEALQDLFSSSGCIVFPNRFDEFFAVTNGLGVDDHIRILQELAGKVDLKVTVSIGVGKTPFEANIKAYEAKATKAVLDSEHHIYGFEGGAPDSVTIMHLDVENITSQTSSRSPYEISTVIFKLYGFMAEFFLKKESLAFFMGGDNFMVVATNNAKQDAREFLNLVKKEFGISFNCGIGTAKNCRQAAMLATKSLDTIREIRKSGQPKPEIHEISCS